MNGQRVAGIPIHGPAKPEVQSIEVGIQRVWGAFNLNQILVFDDLHGFLDELQSYSRELDEMGSQRRRSRRRRRFTCSTRFGMLFLICTWTNPGAGFRAVPWRGGGCRIFERGCMRFVQDI